MGEGIIVAYELLDESPIGYELLPEDDQVLVKAKIGPDLKMSHLKELVRQGGLTARYGLKGLTAIPSMPGDAIGLNATGAVETLADKIGLPRPSTTTEKIAEGATEALVGSHGISAVGRGMSKAAPTAIRNIGELLASNPLTQAALSGVSGGSVEYAKNKGVGPVGQAAVAFGAPMVAGSVAPLVRRAAEIPWNIASPIFSKSVAETQAARMANDVSGSRAGNIANRLFQATPEQTAGQAALDSGSAEFQALQKYLRNMKPSEYVATDIIQKDALKDSWKTLNKSTSPIRNKALSDANVGGVKASSVTDEIDSILADPNKGRADTVVSNTLGAVRDRITKFTDPNTGVIDSRDLYTIRKKIGTTIKTYSKENSDWDKALTAGLERDIQKAIDSAIVDAETRPFTKSGSNWMTYLSDYSKEAKRLAALKEADKTAKVLSRQGMKNALETIGRSENPIERINFLDRTMLLINAALRKAEGSGGKQTEEALSRLMLPKNLGGNPNRLGSLMMQEEGRVKTLDEIIRNLKAVPRAGATGLLNY